VAHDFNNLLSVIGGNADLLLEGRPDDRLRRIRETAEVGAALTRQLLAFSQQSVVRPGVQDLGEVIRDTARIIERLIGEHISIRLDLSGERCAVLADRAQLQQILLNLCINSRDAMPGGGLIRIVLEPVPGEAGGPADGWVRLAVEDTGTGMDEATRARAFEPFFTTKAPGKGTGLGLYSVRDAVTRAEGRIAIDSVPGRGTRVSVLLPRRRAEPAAIPRPSEAVRGGGESILAVEDHPALRELIRCFLADAGYRVHVVGRPGEAEALWEREQGGIDLLVTDLVMPEKSGRALAAELSRRKPSLKTLFISGYAQGSGPEKRVEGPYLQKPFTRVELLHTVRAILDGGRDGDGARPASPAPQAAAETAGSGESAAKPARPRGA
jgi:CheY-like chemotaxis protein